MRKKTGSFLIVYICFLFSLSAQDIHGLKAIGKIKTQSTQEINSSRWSVGGETLDRDYADYDAYKTYLNDLGAKRIRFQGGWAKCEKQKGKYDFSWLDKIVDDAIERGVQPWLQLSYGNPIYEGGGEAALAGGIPTSKEAIVAWENWVVAMVSHFKNRITEWEIWNEPDLSKRFYAKDFNPFYERTAALLKKEQPDARLIALGLASLSRIYYADSLLLYLKAQDKLSYVDVISYHGYSVRPEDSYPYVVSLLKNVKSYENRIALWQGENGAPSTPAGQSVGALTQDDWSETTQAKWNLRRMVGDMAHDVDVTNIFQISDMYYSGKDHFIGLNSKGLLRANPDKTIESPKLAYFAYQHAASLFSGNVKKLDIAVSHNHEGLWAYAFQKDDIKAPAIALWFAQEKPMEKYAAKPVTFSIIGMDLDDPVMVDLLTGEVSELQKTNFRKTKNSYSFSAVPVTDSPVVICSKRWLTVIKP